MRHKGESSSSDSSDSDDNDDGGDETGAKDNTCYSDSNGAVDGGGDRNTGAIGASAEWIPFLSPRALSETLGAMEKAKASSSTKSKKT